MYDINMFHEKRIFQIDLLELVVAVTRVAHWMDGQWMK